MNNNCQHCYHCHEPIPAGVVINVSIQDQSQPMCCHGCATVATLLTNSGLEDFYAIRTAAAVRPQLRSETWWQAFDDPALIQQVAESKNGVTYTLPINVDNLRCAACVWLLESCLGKLNGVEHIVINYATGQGQLSWRSDAIRLSNILLQADKLGYPMQPAVLEATNIHRDLQRRSLRRMLVAALGMFQVMMMSVGLYLGIGSDLQPAERDFLRWIALLLATPVVWYSGWPFFQAAWHQCRALRPAMDVPVSLAIALAWFSSCMNTFTGNGEVYFDSAVMFVFFLSVSRHLEQAARLRAQAVSNRAAQALPLMVKRLQKNGDTEVIQALRLQTGDRILAAAGETLAADGMLLGEHTVSISESLISGEAKPLDKQAGDSALAGSQIVEGIATIEVTACGKNTVLASIQRLANSSRMTTNTSRWINQLAVGFTLGLLCLAVSTAVWYWPTGWQHSLQITLSVLVVSCPCALALAIPSVLAAAQARLARQGILFRDASAIFRIPKITQVLLDKTGTLTQGKFTADTLLTTAAMPATTIKQYMAALASGSHHPIVESLQAIPLNISATGSKEITGQGICGNIAAKNYRLGKLDYVAALSGSDSARLRQQYLHQNGSSSELWLGDEQQVLGVLLLDDQLKPQAKQHLENLQLPAVIISGDTQAAVSKTAGDLDIDKYAAQLQPQDKLAYLQQQQSSGHKVLAVGDGINDAPLLAAADVSVAIGSQHSLAKASADVLILHDRLAGLVELKTIAILARRRIRQNLSWALIYNVSIIPFAMLGMLPPWLAALGMSLSSLLVVGNSLRLNSMSVVADKSCSAASNNAMPLPAHAQLSS